MVEKAEKSNRLPANSNYLSGALHKRDKFVKECGFSPGQVAELTQLAKDTRGGNGVTELIQSAEEIGGITEHELMCVCSVFCHLRQIWREIGKGVDDGELCPEEARLWKGWFGFEEETEEGEMSLPESQLQVLLVQLRDTYDSDARRKIQKQVDVLTASL